MIKKIQSWQQILIALILGASAGLYFGPAIQVIAPLGELFIRAIHMIIVPVVFFSIVNAITSIDDLKQMRRIGIKAIFFYSMCMIVASLIGLGIGTLFSPGHGIDMAALGVTQSAPVLHSLDFNIVDLLPDNILAMFVSGNVLQILLFAILCGFALSISKNQTKPIIDFVHASFKLTIVIAQLIMKLAPLGIFGLIATVTGQYGIHALIPLLKLVAAVYTGCLVLWMVYAIYFYICLRQPATWFFKQILSPIIVSFTTSSSAATLPVTLECAKKKLFIDKNIADFLLPLGTSLNLNGLSVYLSVAAIFAANIYGIELTLLQYLTLPLLIVVTAVGAAAIPGSALIVMGAIQSAVGIPLGAIPLIAAVDRLNDMAQTCTNVTGDLFAAYSIDRQEKTREKAIEMHKTIQESLS